MTASTTGFGRCCRVRLPLRLDRGEGWGEASKSGFADVSRLPDVPTGTPPLLGRLSLDILDLDPNTKERKLEGNPKYDGKQVMDLL